MATITRRNLTRAAHVLVPLDELAPAPPRRQPWRRFTGVVSVLAGIGLWALLARLNPPSVLPGPGTVAVRLWTLAVQGVLWPHVITTLTEALLGFGLALVTGVVVGYVVARSALLESFLAPYIAGTQAVPVVAVAPLLVLWFGFDLLPKVLTCAVIVFFPIVVNTILGLRSVDRDLREAAQTFGAGHWQMLRYVELPLALRALLTGVQLGLTLALTGAVVGEFVAANSGLGFLLTYGRSVYDTPLVFAALLTLAALAILGYMAVGLLARRLIDWE